MCVCAECPELLADDLDGAFGTFVRHHQDFVYGMGRRMTPTPADAEDLAQDTFIRAYRALTDYDSDRIASLRPRAWLAAIATNVGRNRARRKAVRPADIDDVAEPRVAEERQPERIAERREEARIWRARLARVPARYRRAVELRHVDGLSYPELAEALGRPLGTVKSDVHRGVAALRAVVEAEDEAPAEREVVA